MIVQWFCELFYNLFDILLGWINIPGISQEQFQGVTDFIPNLVDISGNIFLFFIPQDLLFVFIPPIVIINTAINVYYLVIWILKKIPMASIS